MTREEAIKYLEQHKYANTCGQKSLEESNEAIDMAIEALSAEQVTSKLKNPCDSLLKTDSADAKEHKSKLDGDLISRADAIEAIIAQRAKAELSEYNFALGLAEDAIRHLPSAEAVQGEWIRSEGGIKDWEGTTVGYSYWYECDQCGARPPKDQWKNEWHSPYCPSCGARMKGGGSE